MKGRIIMRGGSRCIIYDAPPGPDGKRRQIFKTLGPGVTLKQAEKILADKISEANHGMAPAKEKMKVGEYLDQWLASMERTLSPSTFASYSLQVRLHIKPALGNIALASLGPLHIEKYLATTAAIRRGGGKGALSARSVHLQWSTLSMALRQAVIWGLILRNPCDAVRAPKRGAQEETAVLDIDALRILLNAAAGTWLYLPILLAAAGGLRRGEVCALKWDDVDLDTGALVVRHSVQTRPGQVTLKCPKSGKPGAVRLGADVIDELRLEKAESGGRGFVATHRGQMILPDRLTAAFRRFARRNGLNVTFHGLRHTHATILLAAGVPQRIAMDRLRHSTLAMMQRYSHVLPVMQDQAAEAVDRMLRPEEKGK